MTGTACHEGIAGALAAVEYLAALGRRQNPNCMSRRTAIEAAFAAIRDHEQRLARQILQGLGELPNFRLWGMCDVARLDERVPTFSLTHPRHPPELLATRLAAQGCYTWAGNHYALGFSEAANLEPHGTLRIGLLHYNTATEVDWVLKLLREFDR